MSQITEIQRLKMALVDHPDFSESTDPKVLEAFRSRARQARVFDFDDPEQWELVRPHLAVPSVQAALDLGMREMCESDPACHGRNPGDPPWTLTPSTYWWGRIDERLATSGSLAPVELKGERPPMARVTRTKPANEFEPSPGTPDWYRVIHGDQWIAPWCAAIGRLLFPHLKWFVVRQGDGHCTAWGRPRGKSGGIIMDILSTGLAHREGRTCTGDEIVDAVLRERVQGFAHAAPPPAEDLGTALLRMPGIVACSVSLQPDQIQAVSLDLCIRDFEVAERLARLLWHDALVHGARVGQPNWHLEIVDSKHLRLGSVSSGERALASAARLRELVDGNLRGDLDITTQVRQRFEPL